MPCVPDPRHRPACRMRSVRDSSRRIEPTGTRRSPTPKKARRWPSCGRREQPLAVLVVGNPLAGEKLRQPPSGQPRVVRTIHPGPSGSLLVQSGSMMRPTSASAPPTGCAQDRGADCCAAPNTPTNRLRWRGSFHPVLAGGQPEHQGRLQAVHPEGEHGRQQIGLQPGFGLRPGPSGRRNPPCPPPPAYCRHCRADPPATATMAELADRTTSWGHASADRALHRPQQVTHDAARHLLQNVFIATPRHRTAPSAAPAGMRGGPVAL